MTERQIGPYTVREELARGGMGVVYRAHDPRVGRDVALKLLLGFGGTSPTAAERLRREAEALARLSLPAVVTVHEFAWEQGKPYLVLELVEGESLERRLEREGPLGESEAARLVEELARALAAAHSAGVLHRDLKPANVILRKRGEDPVLIDFGLAQLADDRERLTRSGTVVGTPSYMAPEQAKAEHERIGPATDIYGLGAILYALLTGQPPFSGSSTLMVLSRVAKEPPRPPSELRPDLSPRLEEICLTCLRKNPDHRYPSMQSLADALAAYRAGGAVADRRPTWIALAWLVVAIVPLAALGVVLMQMEPARPVGQAAAPELPEDGAGGRGGEPSSQVPASERLRDPKLAAALRGEAQAAWAAGRFARARGLFEKVLHHDPGNRDGLLGRARVLMRWGDLEAALRDVEAAPGGEEDEEALGLKADLLGALRRKPEWDAVCTRLEERFPGTPVTLLARGRGHLSFGELGEATEFAKRVLDQMVSLKVRAQAVGLKAHAQQLEALGGEPEFRARTNRHVIADAEKALRYDPSCHEARVALAFALACGSAWEKALNVVEEMLRKAPEHPEYLIWRGFVHTQMGDSALAKRDYEASLRAWPGYPAAHNNLAGLWLNIAKGGIDPPLTFKGGAAQALLEALRHLQASVRSSKRSGGTVMHGLRMKGAIRGLKKSGGASAEEIRALEAEFARLEALVRAP